MRNQRNNEGVSVGRAIVVIVATAAISLTLGFCLLAHLDRNFGARKLALQETEAGRLYRTASVEQAR